MRCGAWRRWSRVAAKVCCLLLAGGAVAQETPFVELCRYRWRTPPVACVAQDAAGSVVAYAVAVAPVGDEAAAGGTKWELVTYDPRDRRETARCLLPFEPKGLRVREPGHVDVRVRDHDRWLSWFHWHTLRLADGAVVGEPVRYAVTDDDPMAGSKLRDAWEPAQPPRPFFRADGSLAWGEADREHAITDRVLRGVAMTPDGRFAVLWLPSRLVAIAFDGRAPRDLGLRSEAVAAVTAGANGDEVLVLSDRAVDVVRCGGGEARRLETPVAQPWHAALQPAGSLLAIAAGHNGAALLDMATGAVEDLGEGYGRVAWLRDGASVVGTSRTTITCWDEHGREAWRLGEQWDRKVLHFAAHGFAGAAPAPWNIVPVERDRVFESYERQTWLRTPAGDCDAGGFAQRHVAAALGGGEVLVVDAGGLGIWDAATQELRRRVDFDAPIGAVAVAGTSRRIAAVVGDEVRVFDVPAVR